MRAREHDLADCAARAYGNLAFVAARSRSWTAAERWLDEGLRWTAERDLELWRGYLLAWRAYVRLGQARWDEAAADAEAVLAGQASRLNRASPLLVLALVRARRGDPGTWDVIGEAMTIARASTRSRQRLVPVTLVAVEAAVWRARCGCPAGDPGPVPEPFARELAGDFEGAAAAWAALDCPYETASALAQSDEEALLRRAHEALVELGAQPAAAIVARRLRERGVRGIPRGPRPSTQAHPSGLTRRELEVLELVGDGLRNCDIADRLVISEKTVDHHVSAILRKLGARSRTEAVRLAAPR